MIAQRFIQLVVVLAIAFLAEIAFAEAEAPTMLDPGESPPSTPTPPPSGGGSTPPPSTGGGSSDGFPDETNTGVTQACLSSCGGSLRQMSGTVTVRSGETLECFDLRGQLDLEGSATARCGRVRRGGGNSARAIQALSGNVRLQNIDVDGENSNICLFSQSSSTIAERMNLHHCRVGGYGYMTLRDSYIHDSYYFSGSHNDGYAMQAGGGTVLDHNRIVTQGTQTDAILIQSNFGDINGVTITNNFLAGGGFQLYVDKKADQRAPSNVTVTGNVFEDHVPGGWSPGDECGIDVSEGSCENCCRGYYGFVTVGSGSTYGCGSGFTWSNNRTSSGNSIGNPCN